MEPPRPLGRLGVAILLVTTTLAIIAVIRNDFEAQRFFCPIGPDASSLAIPGHWSLDLLPPWAQSVWAPARRVESDIRAVLAVATLGVGLVILIRPGQLRSKRWPGPGVSAMAVATVAEVYMIAWHAYMISQGQYWLDRSLTYLVVFGTVARVQFRTTGVILGTWAILALSRRWRPRPDWLDRLGLVLGGSWIGLMVLKHLMPSFWMP